MPKINRNGQASILTTGDLSKIRKQLKCDRDRLLFDLLTYTGERVGAIVQLQWRDAYEKPGKPREIILFRARTRKAAANGPAKSRQVPVHERLAETLSAYQFSPLDSQWLFPARESDRHIPRQTADALLRAACERAGLGGAGISSHSFRRTLITRLSDLGVSARTIQQVTGHANLNSVQHYIEADERRVRDCINLL